MDEEQARLELIRTEYPELMRYEWRTTRDGVGDYKCYEKNCGRIFNNAAELYAHYAFH